MATYLLFQVVRTPFYDLSGVELAGGYINTYLAGTSTPVATYSDNTGTSYGTSVTLDSTGRTPYGWYGNQDVAYKIRVFDSLSVEQTQYQQDNVTFPPTASPLESFELQRASFTDTGTVNSYDVDGLASSDQTEISFLEWAGASAITLTGISALNGATPADGRVIYGKNTNTNASNYMWLKSNDTGSSAAFRFTTVSSNGQYIGAGGTWQMIYDANALRWMVSVIDPGAMISPVFSSGDFTGADWTVISGNVTTRGFQQRGKNVSVSCTITGATAPGARPLLTQIIPGGFTASTLQQTAAVGSNGGTVVACYVQAGLSASSPSISGVTIPAGNWTAGSVTLSCQFSIVVD